MLLFDVGTFMGGGGMAAAKNWSPVDVIASSAILCAKCTKILDLFK